MFYKFQKDCKNESPFFKQNFQCSSLFVSSEPKFAEFGRLGTFLSQSLAMKSSLNAAIYLLFAVVITLIGQESHAYRVISWVSRGSATQLWLTPDQKADIEKELAERKKITDEKRQAELEKVIARQRQKADQDYQEGQQLEDSMRTFRDEARKGIEYVTTGRVDDALLAFDRANRANSSQALPQRGILLYCVGDFENAQAQLGADITILEKPKFQKIIELRIWRSACLFRLGRREEALNVLDIANTINLPCDKHSLVMNYTAQFFAGERPIEDILEFFGNEDEKDVMGRRYYGNMYLGLYFDAMGEKDLAQAFLAIPAQSSRYGETDMWYHIPRIFYRNRYPDDDDAADDTGGGGGKKVSKAGMIF